MAKETLNSIILIDRTGSMLTKWNQTIKAVNEYINKTKEYEDVKTRFTVMAFDRYNSGYSRASNFFSDAIQPDIPRTDIITYLRVNETGKKIKDIGFHEIGPRGMTPLYDAVSRAISEAEKAGFDKTTIIVVTDGLENASTEYTTEEQIKSRIKSAEARGWEVLFIGAEFESEQMSTTFGLDRSKFLDVGNAEEMSVAMAATSDMTRNYMSGLAMNYSDGLKGDLKNKTWEKSNG